jgi:1-acyl-sn-glycerol-3-phosphate acyltransferase
MNAVDITWAIGRMTIQPTIKVMARLKVYGEENVPRTGGCVLACNHFSWVDPPILGIGSPRNVYFMAKIEAHKVPGLGAAIRSFGTFPVRRGESDREAVRTMRRIVEEGKALGLFVEGTRQRGGVPGDIQPGAAMVAIQEGVPIIPAAIHGSQTWRFGNFHPVSLAWGAPMVFDGLPKGGKGYKEASVHVQAEIRRLFDGLVELHQRGRVGTSLEEKSQREQRP